ncbi:MAG: cobalamin B12-binding domain-containing protein [Gammaproteobacteria bacterium]|nr:cobalamin B12-binding domain-containing protein [Gammaproteobacteria bacterium]
MRQRSKGEKERASGSGRVERLGASEYASDAGIPERDTSSTSLQVDALTALTGDGYQARMTRPFRLDVGSDTRLDTHLDPGLGTGLGNGEVAASVADSRPQLMRAIEHTVIPSLIRNHRRSLSARGPWPGLARHVARSRPIEPSMVDMLVQHVLRHDAGVGLAYVNELRRHGVGITEIFLELLTPCARRLGDLWLEDECSFAEVTLGLCRIHQIFGCFRERVLNGRDAGLHRRRALLSPAPGEMHMLGIQMVAAFFERAGWQVTAGEGTTADSLERLVAGSSFDVMGLSLSCERDADLLGAQIARIRAASRNPSLIIMIGGPAVVREPSLVQTVGADCTAETARSAVLVAENLRSLAS